MNSDDHARIDSILDRWESSVEASQPLTAEELCSDCPELLPEVSRRLRLLSSTEWMQAGPASPSISLPGTAGPTGNPRSSLPDSQVTADEFVSSVSDSGLLNADELIEFRRNLAEQTPEYSRTLAAELVELGKLTAWQASILLSKSDRPLIVDRYVILDVLGSGGMGVVYKARHRSMDRVVALKMLPHGLVDSEEKTERFRREMRAAARLSHPNVVSFFDADESADSHFLAMEYVRGSNLADQVRDNGPLRVSHAIDCITQAARGLQHAHENGIIHRDVKPGNLLLTEDGQVKITDMGLATLETVSTSDSADDGLTGETILGTIAYISPEQAIDTSQADARSDIYSLGATLFFLLTGQPPFCEKTAMKTLIAHREKPVPRLGDVLREVPREAERLEPLLRTMLAKSPDDRFQTASELAIAFEQLGATSGHTAAQSVTIDADTHSLGSKDDVTQAWNRSGSGSDISTARDLRFRTGTVIVSVAVLLVIVGIVAWPLFNRRPDSAPKSRTVASLTPASNQNLTHEPVTTPEGPDASPREPASPPPWTPGPGNQILPGLIPNPTREPGIRRWQMELTRSHGEAQAIARSPDEQVIAVANGTGAIHLRDAESLELQHCLLGHTAAVTDLEWSPDGVLASASRDGTVRLWSADGRQGPVLRDGNQPITKIAWHPSGTHISSSAIDGSIRTWSTDGTPDTVVNTREDSVENLTRRSGEQQLGTAGRDETTRLRQIDAHPQNQIRSVSRSKDATQFVTRHQDGTIRTWKFDGTAVAVSDKTTSIEAVVSSEEAESTSDAEMKVPAPDGGWTAIASGDGSVLLQRADESFGPEFQQPGFSVTSIAWTADSQRLAVAYQADDEATMLLRILELDGSSRWNRKIRGGIVGMAWNETGRRLAVANELDEVAVVDSALLPAWQGLVTDSSEAVILAANGRPLAGNPSALDSVAVYVIEHDDGRLETVAPSVFHAERGAGHTDVPAPPAASTPFSPDDAWQHQETWAKFLNEPVLVENVVGMRLALIPPGDFEVGYSEGQAGRLLRRLRDAGIETESTRTRLEHSMPAHRVTLTQPWYCGCYPVTVGQFRAFVDATGYRTTAETNGGGVHDEVQNPEYNWMNPGFDQADDHPVVQVSYHDAVEFCDWLTTQEGRLYVLPTEAQWEYACRAGSQETWFHGSNPGGLSPYSGSPHSTQPHTLPVGLKKSNPFGIYDLYGNP